MHRMWGARSWHLTDPGKGECWGGGDPGMAGGYFDQALAGYTCDANWYEGAHGTLGDARKRPTFPSGKAPALLGFDSTIWGYCSHAIGEGTTWGDEQEKALGMDFNSALAHRCVAANENILRLLSRNQPYTLCQNLRWLLCAVQGKLPHQKGKELHFASAPKDVDWNVWDDPARGDAWWPEPHESSFAVSDVFFVELALLNALCKNADELFRVEVGETFVCELVKENAFKRVVRVLV